MIATNQLLRTKALWTAALRMGLAFACVGVSVALADINDAVSAAALRTRYDTLQNQLNQNQYKKPLYLESAENPGSVTGDIYARVEHPFAISRAALNGADRWCGIMMLHLNTKHCQALNNAGGSVLQVHIGKKHDQPVDDAYRLDFAYRVATNTPDYLKVMLTADAGPLGTREYRVILEAVPLENGTTFLHFTYSYGYGVAGRLALQTYLGTIGRTKVGFTVVSKQSDGELVHIGGMRGLVERNTMRYYLAIEAYLGALSVPPQARLERRLHDWFAAIERYPRQLHEMERDAYLEMKRKEFRRLPAV